MRACTTDKKFIDFGSRWYDWMIQSDPFIEATPFATEPERFFNRRIELLQCDERDPDIHIDDASEVYKFFSMCDHVSACPDLDIWIGPGDDGRLMMAMKVAEKSVTIILANE